MQPPLRFQPSYEHTGSEGHKNDTSLAPDRRRAAD